MPASSAMRASLTLSAQLPDQRSGTKVTARPDEQLAPNRPILSALPLYMAVRCCMAAAGASTGAFHHRFAVWADKSRPQYGAILFSSNGRSERLPSPLRGGVGGGGRRVWHRRAPRHDPPLPTPSPT